MKRQSPSMLLASILPKKIDDAPEDVWGWLPRYIEATLTLGTVVERSYGGEARVGNSLVLIRQLQLASGKCPTVSHSPLPHTHSPMHNIFINQYTFVMQYNG